MKNIVTTTSLIVTLAACTSRPPPPSTSFEPLPSPTVIPTASLPDIVTTTLVGPPLPPQVTPTPVARPYQAIEQLLPLIHEFYQRTPTEVLTDAPERHTPSEDCRILEIGLSEFQFPGNGSAQNLVLQVICGNRVPVLTE